MNLSSRAGLGVDPRRAGFAPIVALVVGAIGLAMNVWNANGDMRVGVLPWAMTIAALCLAVCSLGVLNVHGPNPSRWIVVGAWWTTLALIGVAGFFLAVALGTLLGIDEEEAGLLTWPPLLGIMFGVLSMAPALLAHAVGVTGARVLRWFGRAAVWVAAPVLPLVLVFGGIAEGTAETVGMSSLMGLFAGAWIVLGLALVSAETIQPGNSPSVPGSRP
jgi:hypothetical protein